MAATFVVEDGSGKSDANSYCSVAFADQYFENHNNPSDWTGATQAEKEMALRNATQYLDLYYGGRWRGRKKLLEEDQSLDWPRYEAYDDNDRWIDSETIPVKLQEATAEAALRDITETDGLVPDIDEPGTVKKYSVKVGPISESTEWMGGKKSFKRFRTIDYLVRGLTHSGYELQRA